MPEPTASVPKRPALRSLPGGLCILACMLLLAACGGGGGSAPVLPSTGEVIAPVQPAVPAPSLPSLPPSTPTSPPPPATPQGCTLDEQRAWLRADMDARYFWYDQQGVPNPAATSLAGYFDSLLFKPADSFSFAQNEQQFTQFFTEGRRVGYGYALAFADAQRSLLQFAVVEPLSPMAQAGVQRGDTVLAIDGLTPAQIAAGGLPAVSTEGVARRFSLRQRSGLLREVTVLSANFALSPVLATATFVLNAPQGQTLVGYLAYQQFIAGSDAALKTALNKFYAAGVQELVLDLRYNGGGRVSTARDLASLIGGDALDGRTFANLNFNNKNQASNQVFRFVRNQQVALPVSNFVRNPDGSFGFTTSGGAPDAPVASSSLRRLFVIASAATASASELVINGLRPFMRVVQIGATTNGKPYGFAPRANCGTVYNAVNFDSVNALGVGGYVNGLPATCNVPDDLNHLLGDAAEARTAAALAFIASGTCPAGAQTPLALQVQGAPALPLGEIVPPQMFSD